ncbi:MAG: lysophospholipid acyltransferase family protein [Acidobacteria bacterium]|nr:lysophospholipid acyltransferase family protein [Acidobacteriota bacterium]
MSRESPSVHPAIDLALETVVRCIGLLPRRMVMETGGTLAAVLSRLLPRKRAGAIRNARLCGIPDQRRFYYRAAREFGRTTLELTWLLAHADRPVLEGVEVEGLDCLQEAAAEGRGVLLVSGHFATWDFVGPAGSLAGVPIAGTARTWRFRRLERRLLALREGVGAKTLMRGEKGTGIAAYRWLKKGGIYFCMMDRISAGRRIMVPFIGEGLNVPTGPAEMAVRSGAAVVVGFATRLPDGTPQVEFRRLSSDDYDSPESLCVCIGREIERHLRSWPEQWFWIFRRNPIWPGDRGVVSHEPESST